ncbi:hypothetical protein [Neobacillus niacini]|uniref:hypothetical protein n=1 Tax=Neobacillus niacini TaxID=86668 RepID=UPI003983447C
MKKAGSNEIQRGQAISFRIPSDTPDHLVKQLQKLKETERRNFSSKIAEFVMEGVGSVNSREREMITVPLPKQLTKAQRDWLKHEHSEALLGSIIYQLITDPVRSTSLLASLNSKSTDIDEALYLQEDILPEIPSFENESSGVEEMAASIDLSDMNDDLSEFDWEKAKPIEREEKVEEEPDLDDLLGGFLASMNK